MSTSLAQRKVLHGDASFPGPLQRYPSGCNVIQAVASFPAAMQRSSAQRKLPCRNVDFSSAK
jgi:hypothetical protein